MKVNVEHLHLERASLDLLHRGAAWGGYVAERTGAEGNQEVEVGHPLDVVTLPGGRGLGEILTCNW